MRDHGGGLVGGLLRARLGFEPGDSDGSRLLLDDDLGELSGIGRRDSGRGGE